MTFTSLFNATTMKSPTPTEPPTLIVERSPMSSFPSFTPEELGLSPSPPQSPLPSDSNKDFENTQRDCSLFPAYTDYLYGPDTRPQPPLSSAALLPQSHFVAPVPVYPRNWIPPEEIAYRLLHQRAIQQTIAARPTNNFPQLCGLTNRPPSASPAPTQQTAASVMPDTRTRSVTRAQIVASSPSYSSGRAPVVQIQRAPSQDSHSLATQTPQPTQILQQSPQVSQTPQPPQQGPNILMPGQILTMRCQGISDHAKQSINTRVTMCWAAIRAPEASHENKQKAKAYLVHITNQVYTQHSNWMMRDGIRNLWRSVKITEELPSQDPRHVGAREYVADFHQKLSPDAARRVAQALNAMTQAEREGREPLDEVEKYTNSAPTAASPSSYMAAASPGQYLAAASSSFPYVAAPPGSPHAVHPSGQHPIVPTPVGYLAQAPSVQYPALTPSVQHPAPAPSIQYPAAAPVWAMSEESMYV